MGIYNYNVSVTGRESMVVENESGQVQQQASTDEFSG